MRLQMTGHGKWSQPNVPRKGWTCFDYSDLGSPSAICEMCEHQEIRYVHHMSHPNYHGTLAVGCVCAENMELNYNAPKERERKLKNIAAKRRKWLSRNWKISSKGNDYIVVDGIHVVVFKKSGKWAARITDQMSEESLTSSRPYPTQDEAKLAAFDAMVKLRKTKGWGKSWQ